MAVEVTLLQGDCLELIGTLDKSKIYAVITDPPYGIKTRTMNKTLGRSKLAECNDFPPVAGDDVPFDPAPWLDYPVVVMFGANNFADKLPSSTCWLVWDKREGITPNDQADCELAWTNKRMPSRLYHHLWSGMIKASENTKRRLHPTQKPVSLMKWVLEHVGVKPGMTVLDPYMGSGSTGVACVELGIDFIGMELEPQYFEIANTRITEANIQMVMF